MPSSKYLVSQNRGLSDTHLQVKINTLQESQFRSERNTSDLPQDAKNIH